MKRSLIFICINIFIFSHAKSQDTVNSNSIRKEWESEVEKVVFRSVMANENDSISFIEAYLVFQVSSDNIVKKSFLIIGKNQIDSINNIKKLYSSPYRCFTTSLLSIRGVWLFVLR